LFYAGSQTFVNRYFNFSPTTSFQQYYFNIIQQPVNMITGLQRQHRKSVNYVPIYGGDPSTTDQYTRIVTNEMNQNGLQEDWSRACELAAITGMVLVQPYLDFTGKDPAQGELKLKVWEYNSFLIDPYFRQFDASDCQFIWCQEYISKQEAENRFPDKLDSIRPMAGTPQRYGSFYFLPENYNLSRNDLLVLSYVWYRWKTKRKKLYSRSRHQFFDMRQDQDDVKMNQMLYEIPDLEVVEVEVPCWKLAVILNDILMFQGDNPLGFTECPLIPVIWNYEPQVNYYDLRVRSLVRTMRDPQFLFNYKVINNNDIAAASINAGWKRKVGAVANEDNLKKTGQGWDVVINEGFELTDCEKIIPSATPESELVLADQMRDLIFSTAGINLENWSAQNDKQISTLTAIIKQNANLMVFQKYFDQWDYSFKLLGNLLIQIILNNWNEAKVGLCIGEEPSPFFFSGIFSQYQVIVEEGLLTPTQKNFQAQQMLEINERFGREVIPPSMIIKDMNIQGKTEIMQYLQQQEEQAAQMNQEQANVAHAFENAKLQELLSKAASNIATARERHGRSESNIGLFEERLSMISKNHALATKEKVEALKGLLEALSMFGMDETQEAEGELEEMEGKQKGDEQAGRKDAKQTAISNQFLTQLLGQQNTLQGTIK